MNNAQITIQCHPREVAIIEAVAALIKGNLDAIDDRTVADGILGLYYAAHLLDANEELSKGLNDEQRRLLETIYKWADKYRYFSTQHEPTLHFDLETLGES